MGKKILPGNSEEIELSKIQVVKCGSVSSATRELAWQPLFVASVRSLSLEGYRRFAKTKKKQRDEFYLDLELFFLPSLSRYFISLIFFIVIYFFPWVRRLTKLIENSENMIMRYAKKKADW